MSYGIMSRTQTRIMAQPHPPISTRRITVNVPADLLEDALESTGDGITQTVTAGLQKLAASQAYRKLLALKGSGRPNIDLAELRRDREFE